MSDSFVLFATGPVQFIRSFVESRRIEFLTRQVYKHYLVRELV